MYFQFCALSISTIKCFLDELFYAARAVSVDFDTACFKPLLLADSVSVINPIRGLISIGVSHMVSPGFNFPFSDRHWYSNAISCIKTEYSCFSSLKQPNTIHSNSISSVAFYFRRLIYSSIQYSLDPFCTNRAALIRHVPSL